MWRKETIVSDNQEKKSEVARLLAQISNEYEAARQGLSGLAQGMGQHRFITKRMEQIAELHSQLRNLVGDEAMELIDQELDNSEQEEGTKDEKPGEWVYLFPAVIPAFSLRILLLDRHELACDNGAETGQSRR